MRLSTTIHRLGGQTATVTRRQPGTTVNGRHTPGPATTFTVTGSIQPASPRDLERLPEGDRASGAITLWTTVELRTVDEAAGTPPDRLAYAGQTYEVRSVERWPQSGHWHTVATRVVP